jgi:hypothetical protein
MLEWRRARQTVKPGCNPGAVLFRKLACLAKTATRRHGQNRFPGDGDHPQRIAAGLAMTSQANQMNGAVTLDLDSLRFSRTAVKQCAHSHGSVFREDAWLAAILAYSPGWQGIFFLAVKTTSYCGEGGADPYIS